ncbi:zinc ribbon domain-containing protein [Metaclostridioides mangenotii]|uniref:RNA polymerase subunit RPABC4/transcription elongation factor Spt4 n=1 Tax=Metaclostridioides mangenotii TaxID=1540 RepID=A0ABS4EBY3_9FIRM|nr:zinc ribbon domain-containing protein [Clostridioides mangenotii]MBP1855411.1 RNA polymerase subunit RPABC4/transcription elongation factor Spt4 [Clostridioides mangenotii]
MANFCSNCGINAEGSFCSNCGTKLDSNKDTIDIENIEEEIDINDYDLKGVDIHKIMEETSYIKASSVRRLWEKTGIDKDICKKILEKPYGEYYSNNPEVAERHKNRENLGKTVSMKEQLNKEKKDNIKCPKCGSTSFSADKKGFGIGKAVIGASIAGGIGLTAGNIGAKKVRITCLSCGNQFWAGSNKK